jgi:hypothetical protein
MAATTINRGPWNALVDDDGTDTVGTPWTKNEIKVVELDPIDAALAAVEATRAANDAMFLLRAASGNSAVTGFVTFDGVAIPAGQLTMLDSLRVLWNVQAAPGPITSAIRLATAAEAIGTLSPTLPANGVHIGHAVIKAAPLQPTTIGVLSEGMQLSPAQRVDNFGWTAVTVAWSGAWNLYFQAVSVPAGTTVYWSWAVYRIKGQ